MLTANDRLRKQAKKVAKEVHKMNGTVKEAAQEKLRKVRKNGSKRYEEGRGKMHRADATWCNLFETDPSDLH